MVHPSFFVFEAEANAANLRRKAARAEQRGDPKAAKLRRAAEKAGQDAERKSQELERILRGPELDVSRMMHASSCYSYQPGVLQFSNNVVRDSALPKEEYEFGIPGLMEVKVEVETDEPPKDEPLNMDSETEESWYERFVRRCKRYFRS